MTGHPTARVCQVLGIGRATAYRGQVGRPGFYQKPADPEVQAQIREIAPIAFIWGRESTT